jgi:hypothetical protein
MVEKLWMNFADLARDNDVAGERDIAPAPQRLH